MAISPVDRNNDYMREMWGTTQLITDYYAQPEQKKKVLQEVLHDYAPSYRLTKQTEIHEKIRNDADYDDWEYGTEPSYGKPKNVL